MEDEDERSEERARREPMLQEVPQTKTSACVLRCKGKKKPSLPVYVLLLHESPRDNSISESMHSPVLRLQKPVVLRFDLPVAVEESVASGQARQAPTDTFLIE